jgi:uncharacterized protein involved in tolerance to divalent cations
LNSSLQKKNMIQLVIYLDEQHDPINLVGKLLHENLAAKATIDRENTSFFLDEGVLKTQTRNVLTLQTRALLFSEIQQFLMNEFQKEVPMYSLPITQANSAFSDFIRMNTKK